MKTRLIKLLWYDNGIEKVTQKSIMLIMMALRVAVNSSVNWVALNKIKSGNPNAFVTHISKVLFRSKWNEFKDDRLAKLHEKTNIHQHVPCLTWDIPTKGLINIKIQ